MRRTLVKAALITLIASMALVVGSVHAHHDHWLVTPGHVNCDIAKGQTRISDTSHGGYHRFHMNVHIGIPGIFAFLNPNNPVSVGKIGVDTPDECL